MADLEQQNVDVEAMKKSHGKLLAALKLAADWFNAEISTAEFMKIHNWPDDAGACSKIFIVCDAALKNAEALLKPKRDIFKEPKVGDVFEAVGGNETWRSKVVYVSERMVLTLVDKGGPLAPREWSDFRHHFANNAGFHTDWTVKVIRRAEEGEGLSGKGDGSGEGKGDGGNLNAAATPDVPAGER